ncbi:MAG: SH3 domain-containing protein [Alphaproteobacteria bacterium GM7ARS4]|nr:SH3 domain-containing protein [Alphaproteobacteria bacterium GM7ARS4]
MAFILVFTMYGCGGANIPQQKAVHADDGAATGAEQATESQKKRFPYFASLRHQQVNLRAGPSKDYPIKWTYVRSFVPVEVLASYKDWRQVRDWDGKEGWLHRRMLTRQRSIILLLPVQNLYREPFFHARVIARVEGGLFALLHACQQDWCRIEVGGYDGWLHRDRRRMGFWGVYDNEIVD